MGWLEDPRRVVLAAALLVAVPVIVLGEVSASDTRARIRAGQFDAAAVAAERAAAVVGTRLEKSIQLADSTAGTFEVQNAVFERNAAELRARAQSVAAILGSDVATVALVDASGAALEGTPSGNVAESTHFRDARASAQTTLGIVARPGESQRIVIAAPIRRSVDPFIGAVIIEIRLRDVGEWLQPYLGPSEDVYLLDAEGRLLSQATRPSQDVRDLSAQPSVSTALAQDRTTFEGTDPILGQRRFLSSAVIPETGWRVLASRSPDLVEAELAGTLNQLLALRIALVVIALGAALLLARGASALARQRRALATANYELNEATAAKSRFLASMSHDLRTPLNAIIGFSEVLETELFGPLNEKQKEYLADIVSSGKLQLQLVNEILDLSKVEAGKMELAPEEFDLGEALRGVHSVVGALASKKAQELSLDIDGRLPVMYQDPIRVKQVVFNLLGNAVKFTPEGGRIRTRVNVNGDDHVEIAITDSGVGIRPEELEDVFKEFERVGSGYSRKQQGSGLGLALVKRFTEMMGGSVAVASELGRGSTFTVRLPARQP